MPQLTVKAIEALKPRAKAYKVLLDRGLILRISPNGVRALLVRYSVKGSKTQRQYTFAQEYGDGPGQIKLADACAEAQRIRSLARQGVDWPRQQEQLRSPVQEGELHLEQPITFGEALREYVEKKRRAKDGLPLKARTKSDYLGMIASGRASLMDKKVAPGILFPLANRVLSQIAAREILEIYQHTVQRSRGCSEKKSGRMAAF